jgi:sortase (surface protein transpeptidase)
MRVYGKFRTKCQSKISLALPSILIVIGLVTLLLFITSQESAPKTSRQLAGSTNATQRSEHNTVNVIDNFLSFSQPTHISIPDIEVTSSLLILGKNPDGTIEVPSGDKFNKAAWYKHSPAPGQIGAAIIEGHLDYENRGPAVFFRLADLTVGDEIKVRRADNKEVVFNVTKVATYAKDDFPTSEVYAVHDKVALRLITCGGEFNGRNGEYEDNTIVFAEANSL